MITASNTISSFLTCLCIVSVVGLGNHNTSVAIKKDPRDHNESIAIAASSYKDLVKNSKTFVDNTLLLQKILNTPNPSIVIVGPRKWGVTTSLDMLKTFLEIEVDDQGTRIVSPEKMVNRRLFKNGEIVYDDRVEKLEAPLAISAADDILEKYQGQYPVVYVNLKNIDGSDDAAVRKSLHDALRLAYEPHKYVIKTLEERMGKSTSDLEKQAFQNYVNQFKKALDGEFQELDLSVDFLGRILLNHYKRKPFVIFDHYDRPLTNVFRRTNFTARDIEYVWSLMDEIYSNTFKRYVNIKKTIAAGTFQVQPIYRNITWYMVHVYDILSEPRFAEYFATEGRNVEQLMRLHGVPTSLSEQARRWYAGYGSLSGTELYNPFSVAKFLKEKKIAAYWKLKKDRQIVMVKLSSDGQFEEKLLDLLSKRNIHLVNADPQLDLEIQDLKKPWFKDIFAYLYRSGYLVRANDRSSSDQLKIPNHEITDLIANWTASYYQQKYHLEENLLEDAVIHLLALVDTELSDSEKFQKSVKVLYDHYLLQINQTKLHVENARHFYAINRCVTLKMHLASRFKHHISFDQQIADASSAAIKILNPDTGFGVAIKLDPHSFECKKVKN